MNYRIWKKTPHLILTPLADVWTPHVSFSFNLQPYGRCIEGAGELHSRASLLLVSGLYPPSSGLRSPVSIRPLLPSSSTPAFLPPVWPLPPPPRHPSRLCWSSPELLSVRADPSLELLPADLPTEEDVKKWVRPSPCLPPTRVGPPQTPPRCSPPCPQTPPRRPVGLRRTTQSREPSSRLCRSCLRSWPKVEERADVLGPHMSVSGERTIRNMCVQIRFDSRPRRLEDL
jgi:hypothetical protein